MTALAGIWHIDARPNAAGRCESMLRSQEIYAPARPVVWSAGTVALGRRLYQTLPEDRYDIGPIVDEALDRTLVADVRLDNRPELCAELGLSAKAAAETSDAGLLMLALRRWNEEAVEHLIGDFAFVLWDGCYRRLLLARDIAGQRPLHFHRQRDFFAFASMPKGLHALAEVPPDPDHSAMVRFLALIPETGNQSFFKDVVRVRPGEICIVTSKEINSYNYWTPSREPLRLRSSEYEEALREQMDRAVSDRLRGAKGRVAAHLSGGLDSSTVAAT